MPTDGFTTAQRRRIQRDLGRWKLELEMPNRFSDADLEAYLQELQTLDDETLACWWTDNVGEWIASRGDLDIPPDADVDEWLDAQFDTLVRGDTTAYGFVVDVLLPPAA
ncbi:hypothetical protein BN903_281 [Halorubrum sp. AJ67]|nr:hypothetical protein BN903_281 [Halorubrum sp. AJ67]